MFNVSFVVVGGGCRFASGYGASYPKFIGAKVSEFPKIETARHLWIVNQYATIPSNGATCRHFMLARELVASGIAVTLFAGSGHHLHHVVPTHTGVFNSKIIDGVRVVWIKTPVAAQGDRPRRFLAWILFSLRLCFMARYIDTPTTILHSSPSLLPFLASRFLSRRYQAHLLFEFRDVWPMTLSLLGGKSRFHPLIILHGWIERFAVRSADRVLATMEFGWKRVVELAQPKEKFVWIPNGYNEPSGAASTFILPDTICRAFDRPERKLVYLGSIGMANALDLLIDAASLMSDEPVHFYIVGKGAKKDHLRKRVQVLGLENVTFLEPVSKTLAPQIMVLADALLISWHDSPLYAYGISPNKLPEYFSSGRPIVQAFSGAGDLVERARAGFTVPAGDATAFAQALSHICTMDEDGLRALGANGRRFARENLDWVVIAASLRELVR